MQHSARDLAISTLTAAVLAGLVLVQAPSPAFAQSLGSPATGETTGKQPDRGSGSRHGSGGDASRADTPHAGAGPSGEVEGAAPERMPEQPPGCEFRPGKLELIV